MSVCTLFGFWLSTFGSLALVGPPTTAPSERMVTGRAALDRAVAALTAEGREARETGRLPRQRASFAGDFGQEVPPAAVAERLLRPAHRDALVDAYVRWQLSGFDPPWPDLTDRELKRMLGALPPLAENPWADRALIDAFMAVVRAGALPPEDRQRLSRRLDELTAAEATARELNQPALGLRRWLLDRLEADPARGLSAAMERIAARVEAGWDARRQKQRLEARFQRAGRDESLSGDDRRRVARQAERLAGRRRLYVASARIDGEALAVRYEETAVDDFEVRRWVRLLGGAMSDER